MAGKRLRAVLYGQAKIGKSALAETCPGPRLILDAEGGTEYLLNPQLEWADVNDAAGPPTHWPDGRPLGENDSVVLFVGDWRTFMTAMQWLATSHPFASVVLDSLTELQKRCKDNIAAGGQFDQQAWGALLDRMEMELRKLRDMTKKGPNPLWCVVITALVDNKDGIVRSMVQGALSKSLGGMYDVIGYVTPTDADEDGEVGRELCIGPNKVFEAGDRTRILTRTYGQRILVKNPDKPHLGGVDLLDLMKVLNA